MDGYICGTCGVFHKGLPTSYGADAPLQWFLIPEGERPSRAHLEQEICAIDEEYFFVKGNLEIHIHGRDDPFVWTVWTSLSRESFRRLADHWADSQREKELPYFGWLSTLLPAYPDTLNLKTHLHTRSIGLRPFVELEPTEHPLAVEQRNGISLERVAAIAEAVLHGAETPSK